MSIEVEIKAWVDDFDKTLKFLKENYTFKNEYIKEDVYLDGIDSITNTKKEVRLRRVGENSIVTFKERSHRGKVEVNVEKEFNVDNYQNFLYVINQLGYKEYITKNKTGYLFVSGEVNIELSHVKDLGDFIEIEYILEDEKEVENATNSIYTILDNLSIPRSKVEDRFYVQMLNDK